MEGIDLSALFGPTPFFASKAQLRSALELVESYEDGVAVVAFNDGGGTVTARAVRGTAPIPTEADPDPNSEAVIGIHGGTFAVGETTEETYNEALQSAIESAVEEGRELLDRVVSSRETESDLPFVLQ